MNEHPCEILDIPAYRKTPVNATAYSAGRLVGSVAAWPFMLAKKILGLVKSLFWKVLFILATTIVFLGWLAVIASLVLLIF